VERSTARTVANVVLLSAGIAAASLVATRPPLRRAAKLALRFWLGTSIPLFVLTEVSRAWQESRPPADG
jgi:uncharacterized membrane protein